MNENASSGPNTVKTDADIITKEREEVLYKRRAKDEPSIGIAMSGGGIRSATFNLGILRVLEDKGLLKLADYLSTVSGGGYVGSYFLANRLAGRTIEKDETDSDERTDDGVKALKHLRSFGNYLSPALGLFSLDTWSMVMVWIRNTSVLQAFLICVFAACLLLPRFWGMWLRNSLFTKTGDIADNGGLILGSILLFHLATALIAGMLIKKYDNVDHWSDLKATWSHWLRPNQTPPSLQAMRWRLLTIVGIALVGSTMFGVGGFQAFASGGDKFVELAVKFGITLGTAGFFLSLFSLGFGRGFKCEPWLRVLFCVLYIGSLTFLSEAVSFLGLWNTIAASIAVMTVLTAAGSMWVFNVEALEKKTDIARAGLAGIVCGAFAAGGIYLADGFLGEWAYRAAKIAKYSGDPQLASSELWNYALFSSPGLLGQIGLCIIVLIAITGRAMPDLVREAWSRLGALIALKSIALIAIGLIGIYGPLKLLQIWESWNGYVVASGGVATAVLGVLSLLTANSAETDGKKNKSGSGRIKETLISAAPAAFVLILFCAVSLGLHMLLIQQALSQEPKASLPARASFMQTNGCIILGQKPSEAKKLEDFQASTSCLDQGRWNGPDWPSPTDLVAFHWSFMEASIGSQWKLLFSLMGGLFGAILLLALRLDINEFSINRFYRNRISRCFIGAARTQIAHRDSLTGFDVGDDIQMGLIARFLKKELNTPAPTLADSTPIPIINTALNAVGGADAGLSERRAESCFFTPFYAFSNGTQAMPISSLSTGRDPVRIPGEGEVSDVTLGSLVAISGAAANPNMGFHTSPTIAFLLTFFNIRLGWWLGVPARIQGVTGKIKKQFNISYVFFELFGTADTDDAFVNLSDGGHFENLGMYELIRRECDLIIVGDGEQDDKYTFESLGMAVRRCRIDFGAQVNISVSGIRPAIEGGENPKHWAVGSIRYRSGKTGQLLYLKSSYTGNEPYDVQQYRFSNPEFPQQSTGDQFFNESELESYRQLGIHAATELVGQLSTALETRKDWLAAAEKLNDRPHEQDFGA